MKRRRANYRDSTPARANLSKLGAALSTIQDRREVGMTVFVVVWGLSTQEAARRIGLSDREAERILSRAMSRLRHPSRSHGLEGDLGSDGFVMRSEELRRWAQAAAHTMTVQCPCGRRFLPENVFFVAGGRPRRYCSNACRQAAYRARKRDLDEARGPGQP